MTVKPSTKTRTTPKKGSVMRVPVALKFEALWSAYPDEQVVHKKDEDGGDFKDHCAINVSEALYQNGVKLKSFDGAKCWGCPAGGQQHIIRAQEFAEWLEKKRPLPSVGTALRSTGSTFKEQFEGKRGIIYFEDYWQREKETGNVRTGDHIDLWDDGELASIGPVVSFLRVELGLSWAGWFSDFERATAVWLWEFKS